MTRCPTPKTHTYRNENDAGQTLSLGLEIQVLQAFSPAKSISAMSTRQPPQVQNPVRVRPLRCQNVPGDRNAGHWWTGR